ncbi:MAG: hypothetical protein RRX95_06620 [Oscillospiraceae bacterium]
MKKLFTIFALILSFVFTLPLSAFADIGDKPNVKIKIENPPQELYYLDLLYYKDPRDTNTVHGNKLREEHDGETFDLLMKYTDEGWYPALAYGTRVPTFGELYPNEEGVHNISYLGVPDSFKIIIVTKSGEVKVSEVISRKTMRLDLKLDYSDMSYTKPPLIFTYLTQFFFTCSMTMLVEGIILLIFGFKLKENLKPFLLINFATQLVFTAIFSTTFIFSGYLGALLAFFPLELGVILAEVYACNRWLKSQSSKRKIAFAIVANLISASCTFVSFDVLFSFIRSIS